MGQAGNFTRFSMIRLVISMELSCLFLKLSRCFP